MSNAPYYLPKGRKGFGYGHSEVADAILADGLWDSFDHHHMGNCAEACAKAYGFTRQQQDAHAIQSYKRAQAATKSGLFKNEIVPISIKLRDGSTTEITEDEEPKRLKEDKIPTLRPAFIKDPTVGTVTAANSSKINDGAAAVLVTSQAFAKANGLKPLARILGFADGARASIEFTVAPALAIPKAIANAGLSPQDIAFYEINEAFSVVALANGKLLNIDPETINVNGGAVALGHPIGCSGARIVITLLNTLQQKNARYGVAAICNGGGGASAIVIERL